MQGGADQDLTPCGAVTITRRPVGRFANDRQLHSVVRADKPVKHLAAVNADSDSAGHLATTLALLADYRHRRLHRQGRAYRLLVSHGVRLRATEDGKDGVSGDFVDSAVVLENGVSQRREIVVEQ